MTNPDPIVVTDEMRQAVFRDICDKGGHILAFESVAQAVFQNEMVGQVIGAKDENHLPHIRCSRCGRTWIVIDEAGEGYDDAEMRVRDRLLKADKWNRRPERPRHSRR